MKMNKILRTTCSNFFHVQFRFVIMLSCDSFNLKYHTRRLKNSQFMHAVINCAVFCLSSCPSTGNLAKFVISGVAPKDSSSSSSSSSHDSSTFLLFILDFSLPTDSFLERTLSGFFACIQRPTSHLKIN